MKANKAILYSINVQDVQTAAESELGRKLTEAELDLVEDRLGDYIDWQTAIQSAIEDSVNDVV